MNESGFYKLLKAKVFDKLTGFYYDRLESTVSANGLPDLTYSYAGRHGFIELKYVDINDFDKRPFKPKRNISLSQIMWLNDRGRTGGNCWVWIGTRNNLYIVHYTSVTAYWTLGGMTWGDIRTCAESILPIDNIDEAIVSFILRDG